jgi:thioredoxin 1
MGSALEFSDTSFATDVLQSDVPVLVDFSAAWCGPCKQLSPIIEELAAEYTGRVKIGKVDVDESQEVAGRYGIMSVPTVLFFKGGEKVDSLIGLNSKSVYKTKIEGLLGA